MIGELVRLFRIEDAVLKNASQHLTISNMNYDFLSIVVKEIQSLKVCEVQ